MTVRVTVSRASQLPVVAAPIFATQESPEKLNGLEVKIAPAPWVFEPPM